MIYMPYQKIVTHKILIVSHLIDYISSVSNVRSKGESFQILKKLTFKGNFIKFLICQLLHYCKLKIEIKPIK
jgi:hypothetical protein